MRMALLSERLESVASEREDHGRRLADPDFYVVPRRTMMHIQAGIVRRPTRRTAALFVATRTRETTYAGAILRRLSVAGGERGCPIFPPFPCHDLLRASILSPAYIDSGR